MLTMPPEEGMGRLAAPRSGLCVYNCDVATFSALVSKYGEEEKGHTLDTTQLRLDVFLLLSPFSDLVLQLADRPRVGFAGCEELVVPC